MSTIQIKILYFAGIKDITEKEFEYLAIPTDTSLATLSHLLVSRYGSKFSDMMDISMYAIDMEYIEKDQEANTVVKEGAEIAIIPPVSGG